jgi:hypothetical protein
VTSIDAPHSSDVAASLALADELVSAGRTLDAIDALQAANRVASDARRERRIVELRHAAYREVSSSPGPTTWPVVPPGEALADSSPPVVEAAEVTPQVLSTGIRRHGALHVRGLVPEDRVAAMVDGIDRAMAGYDDYFAKPERPRTPWFAPFAPDPEFATAVKRKRKWVRDSSGVWTADSPRVLAQLVDALAASGMTSAITEYFGERPVLSVNKCTLRRVTLDTTDANWHQDGAFLGDGIRTVNVWLALSRCGDVAPGLDIVPARIDHIVETGTNGAVFDWAVGAGTVDEVAATTAPVCRPVFEAGDALVFDDLFLHRTAVDSAMTNERYAIETWFFAPSTYPGGQIPLVV